MSSIRIGGIFRFEDASVQVSFKTLNEELWRIIILDTRVCDELIVLSILFGRGYGIAVFLTAIPLIDGAMVHLEDELQQILQSSGNLSTYLPGLYQWHHVSVPAPASGLVIRGAGIDCQKSGHLQVVTRRPAHVNKYYIAPSARVV